MNNVAPTLFVDFDGTLHVGNTYIGEDTRSVFRRSLLPNVASIFVIVAERM